MKVGQRSPTAWQKTAPVFPHDGHLKLGGFSAIRSSTGTLPRQDSLRGLSPVCALATPGYLRNAFPAHMHFGYMHKKGLPKADLYMLAEGEGFEPSLPGVPVKRFSRPPHSAALPPFQNMYQPPKGLVKKKAPKTGAFEKSLAERWGFEPQIRFWRIHDFQSCSLSQTRTSLQLQRFSRMQGCTLHHLSTG